MPNIVTNDERYARVFGASMINPKNRFKKCTITDIPILINESNQLVCIPNTPEVKHIGISGQTGSGKTVAMNAIHHWDYWLCGKDCVNINDVQKETLEWSMPVQVPAPILKLVNIKPCPNPMVYVYPTTKTLIIDEIDKKFPSVQMTLPLKEIIKNIEKYHELDKSKVYLENIKEELLECTSVEELLEAIDENFPKEMKMEGTKNKLKNIFQDVFNNKIVNLAAPEGASYLFYKDKFGNTYGNFTIQTLMRAGFIPSIQTYDLSGYEYLSAYMSFIIETVFRNQYDDPYFRKRTVSIFIDEVDKLWKGFNGDYAKKSINMIFTNGRAARTGGRWSTQNYSMVTNIIRNNTQYMIIFRYNDSKVVAEMAKDFTIPPEFKKDILTLRNDPKNGIFEVVLVGTQKLVLYDLDTGVKSETIMAQKGKLIPSPARHHIPNISI